MRPRSPSSSVSRCQEGLCSMLSPSRPRPRPRRHPRQLVDGTVVRLVYLNMIQTLFSMYFIFIIFIIFIMMMMIRIATSHIIEVPLLFSAATLSLRTVYPTPVESAILGMILSFYYDKILYRTTSHSRSPS